MKRLSVFLLAAVFVFAMMSGHAAITDDLVCHLPLDSNFSDTSGNGNNGTPMGFMGNPGISGVIGNAVNFPNLAESYVSLGAPEDLLFGTGVDFSVSIWVKCQPWSSDPTIISNKDWGSGSNDGWGVFMTGDGWKVNIASPRGDPVGGSLTDNDWHLVTFTVERDNRLVTYHDGAVVTIDNTHYTGTQDTGLPINIGQDGTGAYGAMIDFNGDDLGIWRRALSAAEVAYIHYYGRQGTALSSVSVGPFVEIVQSQLTFGTQTVGLTEPVTRTVTLENTGEGAADFSASIVGADADEYAIEITSGASPLAVGEQAVLQITWTPDDETAGDRDAKLQIDSTADLIKADSPLQANLGGEVKGDFTEGMTLYLPLDGDTNDASGKGHNGTNNGGTFTSGRVGQAISFGELGFDLVTIPDHPDLQFGNSDDETGTDFTIAAWVRIPNIPPEDDVPIMGNGVNSYSSAAPGWVFNVRDDGRFHGWINGDIDYWGSSGGVITGGEWKHVAMTMEMYATPERILTGYVDGEQMWQRTFNPLGNTASGLPTQLHAGGEAALASVAMDIDEVGIWKRLLSEAEVTLLYRHGTLGEGVPQVQPAPFLRAEVINLPDYYFAGEQQVTNFTVNITNDGIAPLNLAELQLVGEDAAEYAITNAEDTSILPGESYPVELVWTPGQSLGPRVAALSFTHNDTYMDSPYEVDISSAVFTQQKIMLYFQNFNSLELKPAEAESVPPETLGWTTDAPAGWSVDNSNMNVEIGRPEWRGWSFTTMDFWFQCDQQDRDQFTKADRTFAVADSDEYDDQDSPPAFDSILLSPVWTVPAGQTVFVSFLNDYRREVASERAEFIASVNGVDQVLDDFPAESRNQVIEYTILPPNADQDYTIRFKWSHRGQNNWWWAFDNFMVEITDPNAGKAQSEQWMLYD